MQLALQACLCHTGTHTPSPREAPARTRPVRVGVAGKLRVRRRAGKAGAGGDPWREEGTFILAEADDLHFGVRAMGLPFCL